MSTTYARKMILGAATAAAVLTLATGCGGSTAKDQTPGGQPSGATTPATSAPGGGGAAF